MEFGWIGCFVLTELPDMSALPNLKGLYFFTNPLTPTSLQQLKKGLEEHDNFKEEDGLKFPHSQAEKALQDLA